MKSVKIVLIESSIIIPSSNKILQENFLSRLKNYQPSCLLLM